MTDRWQPPFLCLLTLFALGGCASGSVIITGTKRAPLSAEQVSILLEPPTEFETIGLVSASSESGFTEQGSVDYAINKLKKLAAKLGANGVLLIPTRENTTAVKTVQGKAIYAKVKETARSN